VAALGLNLSSLPPHKRKAPMAPLLSNYVELLLEIAAAFRVAAIAIQFNRLARSFA